MYKANDFDCNNVIIDVNVDDDTECKIPLKLDTDTYITTEYPNPNSIIDNNRIRDIYIKSNSPLSLSENNSEDDDEDYDVGVIANETEPIRLVIDDSNSMRLDEFYPEKQKEKYPDKENTEKRKRKPSSPSSSPFCFNVLEKYYEYNDNYSNNLDILITYTRCQKSIYLKSGYITEVRYFLLVLPTIIIGIVISIFAPEMTHYNIDGNIISALNIVMTTLISISNYLKLESKVEMFKQLHKQYEKLELSLEMTNNKLLYIDNQHDKNQLILHKLNDIEIKINEMMEINNVTVPNVIKNSFPIVCNINVFSLLKKLENYKKSLHHKFFNIKTEINSILYKWKKGNLENKLDIDKEKQQKRLLFLYEMKEQLKTEIVQFNEVYSYIDDYFSKEISVVDNMSHFYILFCGWFSYSKPKPIHQFDIHQLKDEKKMIVDKYFRIVLDE